MKRRAVLVACVVLLLTCFAGAETELVLRNEDMFYEDFAIAEIAPADSTHFEIGYRLGKVAQEEHTEAGSARFNMALCWQTNPASP